MTEPDTLPPANTTPDLPVRSDLLTVKLAQELATNLLTPEEIAQQFNITTGQLKKIIDHPQFRELYKEAKLQWNGGLNAKDRTRYKADALVEDSLLQMAQIVNDPDSKSAQIDAFKQIVAVSNHAPKNAVKGEGEGGEKFVLNISLANTDEKVVIEGTPQIDNDEDD